MTDKKKPANPAIEPDTNEAVSSDAEHWVYQDATGFPETDGPHVEQVFKGIPESKD